MRTITTIFFAIFLLNLNYLNAQIFQTSWNSETGIPYNQSFDMNTGFQSFAFTGNGQIAFLLKQDKSIRIFDIVTGEKVRDISIPMGAKDMYYDNGILYVLYQGAVTTISLNDGSIGNSSLQNNSFTEKISVSNGTMYLHSTNNQTWKYISGDSDPSAFSQNKNLFADNISVSTSKTSNHCFILRFNDLEKNFSTVKKLASASVAGVLNGNIYIDVQYIIREFPLKAEREIWIAEIKNGEISKDVSIVSIPDCYYIYVKNDILVNSEACFYALTTPAGAEIHKIEKDVDISLAEEFRGYHFNGHLLKYEEEKIPENCNIKAPITRTQIIANAEPYETHTWTCTANNIRDYYCGGKQVITPSWVSVGNLQAVPYMWGGWSSLAQYDLGIANEVSAGDCNCTGGSAGSSCAVGVDCSGFVTRAWGLTSKYGTSTLPNISTAYSSFTELLPGDIVNYAGSHVRLVHTLNANGTFLIIEASASATDWRVGYSTYTVASLQTYYIPRFYNEVINTIPDTVPPVTTMYTDNWHSDDFDVSFTDTDSSGLLSQFFVPAGLESGNWKANQALGFMFNDFNETLNPEWTLIEPTWAFSGGMLSQSDDILTQNNAYTSFEQDSVSGFLYQWKMKLSGSSSDKRAGIYFFADSATALQRNNAYMVYYRADLDRCQIYKSVNNVITLMTEDPCVIDENNWFDCKVTYNPNSGIITAYLNNEPITTWTDTSPLKSGKYLSLRTGACSALYDEFRVYRSRGSIVNISVGATGMINSDNPDPLTPSCKILSAAIDLAENISITEFTTNIDTSPPEDISGIADLQQSDLDTMLISLPVNAYWNPSYDVNSGINEYMFALGTVPGLDDAFTWTSEADTNGLCTSVSLSEDQIYYFSVKAINNAGLESAVLSSDGFLVDLVMNNYLMSAGIISVFPNPCNDYICFNFPFIKDSYIYIRDVSGKTVFKTEIAEKCYSMNVKDLQPGLYFYSIVSVLGNKSYEGRFAVIR